ncbi:MAG: endonuclease domain-containing protein [Meiothermus sp.]|nr:endonuclease domain-containing protein [Meiothermus sp.]
MGKAKVRYGYALSERARELRRNMTPAERKLWSVLRGFSVRFRRQRPIGPYIVDFYCAEAGLVIEVDGESHFSQEGRAYDARRDAYLQSLGLRVLRFSNLEVLSNADGVALMVERALARPQG